MNWCIPSKTLHSNEDGFEPENLIVFFFKSRPIDLLFILSMNSSLIDVVLSKTDPGLWFGQWNRFLLCQRLCRILQCRHLDGASDHSAHALDPHLRPEHDSPGEHRGPIWRSQRPLHLCAPDRLMQPYSQSLFKVYLWSVGCYSMRNCIPTQGLTLWNCLELVLNLPTTA